jgi:hypothetical protein
MIINHDYMMVMRAGKNHGELSYIKRHEIESWQSIKLFLGLAGVSSLGYLIYIILK